MIVKKIFLMMKRNSITLLGAAILSSGIFYVVNNPDIFTASVLSLQEKAFIIEKGRDIAYKTNSGYVDIFLSQTGEVPASVDFTISFDKDTVTIDPNNLSGQGNRTQSKPDKDDIIITSTPSKNIKKNQSLILLPFTGAIRDILLSEAVGKFANGKTKNLSIGSLNDISSHSK